MESRKITLRKRKINGCESDGWPEKLTLEQRPEWSEAAVIRIWGYRTFQKKKKKLLKPEEWVC